MAEPNKDIKIDESTNKKSSDSFADVEKERSLIQFTSDEARDNLVEELAIEKGINHSKLMWKIDLCVVPPFCLLYFLSFLDRVNISNAKVYGMATELNLKSHEYNTALTLFFVPYIFFEIFSNYALKFVKPHIWLSACIVLFGAVSIGMGFVQNFGQLAACRFLLGIFESGSFPAVFYILSNFYIKPESQRRFSAFFSVTCLAGGCSGALAYRIKDLDGTHGYSSWRWIFIIEGAFTAGLGFFLFFVIPDFPENARFLNANERDFLKKKLEIYAGNSGFEIKNTPKDVVNVFKDPILWLSAFAYFGLIIPSYGYAYFATSIIQEFGYTPVETQRHSIYPWLAAFGWGNFISFVSDKTKLRSPFAIGNGCLAIVGLAMCLGITDNSNARYAGCFLAACGLYSSMPVLVCWTALNYGGHIRKSVGTAWQIGFGNIGGIIATFIFLSEDAPRYVKGLSISIAFTVFAMIFMVLYAIRLWFENKKKGTYEYQAQYNELDERAKIIAGDKNPAIAYLY